MFHDAPPDPADYIRAIWALHPLHARRCVLACATIVARAARLKVANGMLAEAERSVNREASCELVMGLMDAYTGVRKWQGIRGVHEFAERPRRKAALTFAAKCAAHAAWCATSGPFCEEEGRLAVQNAETAFNALGQPGRTTVLRIIMEHLDVLRAQPCSVDPATILAARGLEGDESEAFISSVAYYLSKDEDRSADSEPNLN